MTRVRVNSVGGEPSMLAADVDSLDVRLPTECCVCRKPYVVHRSLETSVPAMCGSLVGASDRILGWCEACCPPHVLEQDRAMDLAERAQTEEEFEAASKAMTAAFPTIAAAYDADDG